MSVLTHLHILVYICGVFSAWGRRVSVSEALSSLSPNIPFLAYKLKQKHAEIEEALAPEDHPYAATSKHTAG